MSNRSFEDLRNDVVHGMMPLDDAVTVLADDARRAEVAQLLGLRLGLECAPVVEALASPNEEALALLCRAAGLSLNGYSAVLRMRWRVREDRAASPAALLEAYGGLARLTSGELAARAREIHLRIG